MKNGRKWSLISKTLIGRNEHIIKNQYISILRFLRRNDQKVNPIKFQEVLYSYNKLKTSQTPFQKRQNRTTRIKPRNFWNQIASQKMELESSKHSSTNQQIDNDLSILIPNPNLKVFEIEEEVCLDLSNNTNGYRQNTKNNYLSINKQSNLQIKPS